MMTISRQVGIIRPVTKHYGCNERTLQGRAIFSSKAPKGRKNVAQGVSPGLVTEPKLFPSFSSTEGATQQIGAGSSLLSWWRENLRGQFARGPGQQGLDLTAEAGQFLRILLLEAFLFPQPAHGAVEAAAGYLALSEAVMRHGQERVALLITVNGASLRLNSKSRRR